MDLRAEIVGAEETAPPENNVLQTTLNVPFLQAPEIMPGTADMPLRAEGPHEVLKNINHFYTKAPLVYEKLATLTLAEIQVCMPKVADILGVPMPATVTWSHEIDPYSGSGTGAHPISGVSTIYHSLEDLAEYMNWIDLPFEWEDVRQGYCQGVVAHELTHLLITVTPLPGFLNEGLATYMEQRVAAETSVDYVCREDGSYGQDFYGTGPHFVPYFNLSTDPYSSLTDEELLNMYITAMCFWDYVEKTYGHEKLQAVARRLNEIQAEWIAQGYVFPEDRCDIYFIRDILNPVLGEDITSVTEPRFGVGLMMSDCQ